MKKMLDLRFAWIVSLIGFMQPAFGQSDGDTSSKGERDIYSSIANYPTDLRASVLTVAQYPQVIVKLERIQARSSQSFQDLIAGYPREEQEKFYELSRYPNQLKKLSRDANMDPGLVVKDIPKESQASILSVYQNHYKELAKIDYIYQSSNDAMQKTLSDYPDNVRDDFQKVVSKPEVMDLLTENIDLTTSLGEDYRDNPSAVVAQLDSLSSVQRQDLADYKKEVESNPAMQKELENASTQFASSYSGSDSPVDSYLGNQTIASPTTPVVNNYYYSNYNPYPYWSSYPYWYATPIWYPMPYYYHTGFYYGAGGRMVVFGFPSYSYSNWFFGFGYRRYPHLYNSYHVYYRPSYNYGGRYGYNYNNRYSHNGGGGGSYSNHASRNEYGSRVNHNGQVNSTNRNSNRSTSFYRPSTTGRAPVTSSTSRNPTTIRNWSRPSTFNTRTYVPQQNQGIRSANPGGGRSTAQYHSGSTGRSSVQPHSSGGGGSRSSGGGGSRGGGGGRRGR